MGLPAVVPANSSAREPPTPNLAIQKSEEALTADPTNSAPEPPAPNLVIQKSEEAPAADPANSSAPEPPNPKLELQKSKEVPTADPANSSTLPVPTSKGLTLEPVQNKQVVCEAPPATRLWIISCAG